MQDKKIVELFFIRSEEAISAVKEKYGNTALRVANNILRDPSDAEECLNDSLLAMWDSVPPNRPESPGAYFVKIIRNKAISMYRRNHAKKRNSEFDISFDELSECISDTNDVEKTIDSKLLTKYIEEFLDSLSAENADIFVMRYFMSFSLKEISSRTNLTEKNISVRLFRMRNSLREHLKKGGMM